MRDATVTLGDLTVPQHVANCVNAFSKADFLLADRALWSTLRKAALATIKNMNAQGVANCVNGFRCVYGYRGRQGIIRRLRAFFLRCVHGV